MCFLGILGIILMITENELAFNRIDHKNTTFSLLIKATITFTTILLVGLVFYYHRVDINLYCIDNSIDDWRIALTRGRIFAIVLEAFICLIHPIPGHFLVEWSSQLVAKSEASMSFLNPYRSSQNSPITSVPFNGTTLMITTTTVATTTATTTTIRNTSDDDLSQSYVPIDVMLSIPSK